MPTHITLIRHGQTTWNADGRWQGHANVPLSEAGIRQAEHLAEHLAAQTQDIVAIYSSDLLRALRTAQIIGEKIGLPVKADARLREIDLGEWQGLTSEEIRSWDGERYHQIQNDPSLPRPGGESPHQLWIRTMAALDDIIAKHGDSHVLVVTHGGTIRTVLNNLGFRDQHYPGPIINTSLTRLLYNPQNAENFWTLSAFNMAAHLDVLAKTTQEE
jgi:2,3-bisphosphoglycerate-dependent phosphoglycerate mutase